MKIALHICCGVCAASVVERLAHEGHEVAGFFYNPNIHPADEHERRLEVIRKVSEKLDFPLEAGKYEPNKWFEKITGLEKEAEGGRRCEVCFRMRLAETYRFMKDIRADAFSTTLTVSPHKSAKTVNAIGREIGGEAFLARDFKKKDGFKRAMELAKEWNLYRQNYCGCIYSMRS